MSHELANTAHRSERSPGAERVALRWKRDRESFEFKTDELLVDEATVRAASVALIVCQAIFVAALILGDAKMSDKTS